ncbi:MAG: hypothetical protein ACKKL6_03955 [Candidatus Komeilibacteria bacterium]
MKKIILLTLIIFSFVLFTPLAQADLGDLVNSEFDYVQEGVTGSTTSTDVENIVINFIQILLGFLGLVFVILIIWSGFQWMTAGGNSTAIDSAKKRIINAIIGLIIVLAAYVITDFVITNVYNSTRGGGNECSSDSDCPSGFHCWTNGLDESRCVIN